jgi:hypothetical protein
VVIGTANAAVLAWHFGGHIRQPDPLCPFEKSGNFPNDFEK